MAPVTLASAQIQNPWAAGAWSTQRAKRQVGKWSRTMREGVIDAHGLCAVYTTRPHLNVWARLRIFCALRPHAHVRPCTPGLVAQARKPMTTARHAHEVNHRGASRTCAGRNVSRPRRARETLSAGGNARNAASKLGTVHCTIGSLRARSNGERLGIRQPSTR